MITLIDSFVRGDRKIEYEVQGDVLKIDVDGIREEFDFTDLPDGRAEMIIPEILDICPISFAERQGDVVTVEVMRLYGSDEKGVYEHGEDLMEV